MSHGTAPSLIVKIGGSLMRKDAPRGLLAQLAGFPSVIIVPGGGTLADAVRGAQPHLSLSDKAAHAMAILAMEQMAYALLDLAPMLTPCRTLGELQAPRQAAALWFPAQMLIGMPGIAESWDVTSDSLSLWLAQRLDAPCLVLVKAPGTPAPHGPLVPGTVGALADQGIVDRAFEGMAHGFKGTIVLVNADDSRTLEEALRPQTPSKEFP